MESNILHLPTMRFQKYFLPLMIFFGFGIFGATVYALPNPASVFCQENGGDLDIATGECIFPNGNSCDEWAYYCKCSDEAATQCTPTMIENSQDCTQSCSGEEPIDGGWSDWSFCGSDCRQIRTCTNPPPSNGGADCIGVSSRSCTGGNCDPTECNFDSDCEKEFRCDGESCIPVGCVGEGEFTPGSISPEYTDHMATECCDGLKRLYWDTDVEGCEEPMVGGGQLCTAHCGNGTCDEGEEKCTCPDDCADSTLLPFSPNIIVTFEKGVSHDDADHYLSELGLVDYQIGGSNPGSQDDQLVAQVEVRDDKIDDYLEIFSQDEIVQSAQRVLKNDEKEDQVSEDDEKDSNLVILIGGVIGGLLLFGVLSGLGIYTFKRMQSKSQTINAVPKPHIPSEAKP